MTDSRRLAGLVAPTLIVLAIGIFLTVKAYGRD